MTALVTINSVIYDTHSAQFVINVSGADPSDTADFSQVTITGQGQVPYTLRATPGLLGSSTGDGSINFSYQANSDAPTFNALFNKNGNTAVDTTLYNVAIGAGFDTTQGNTASPTTGVAVQWSAPTLSAVRYNATTGLLTVTGDHFTNTTGLANDIDFGKLTFTGQGGGIYTLAPGGIELTSATTFSVTLTDPDRASLNALLNKNGTSASGGTAYKLAAADGWNGTVSVPGGDDAVPSTAVTVQGYAPTVVATSASMPSGTDSGVLGDFVTNSATQTLTGNLSANLVVGLESVQVSLDGGAHWIAGGNPGSGLTWRFLATGGNVLIAGTNTLEVRIVNTDGLASTPFTQVYTLDTSPPVFGSAAVSGNNLVMTYAEANTLGATLAPTGAAFNVQAGGAADAVTGVVVNAAAKTVTLALATAVTSGQAVTVAYTDPGGTAALQDLAGNHAATIAAQAVTNNTAAPVPPPAPADPVGGITAVAPPAGGTVIGAAGNDTLSGQGGNDVFVLGGGTDTVNGGAGLNTVVEAGNRAQYTLGHTADGVFTVRGADGSVATLQNVQRITFGDVTIALDATPATGRVAEFYLTALGRRPEGSGLDYYLGQAGAASTTLQIARGFVASAEFAAHYGGLTDSAFITQMYANAFGRAPDAGGLAFYLDALGHASALDGRAGLLAGFLDSAEMGVKLVGLVDQGVPLLAA